MQAAQPMAACIFLQRLGRIVAKKLEVDYHLTRGDPEGMLAASLAVMARSVPSFAMLPGNPIGVIGDVRERSIGDEAKAAQR
jgi:hypothetical protein